MAEANFRTYFHHAAVQNAVRAGEIEEFCRDLAGSEKVNGRPKGRWQPICDGHVLMSIIASYTTLEVAINEFVREGYHPAVRQIRNWPDNIFDYFNNQNPLSKSQAILEVSTSDRFHPGEDITYKDANLVRRLRNYFIHHYPERIDRTADEPVTNLGGALRTRDFDIDLIWLDEGSIYFPSQCLGFGLARWCIEVVVDYIEGFEDRLDVEHSLLGRDEIYMSDLDEVK